MSTHAKVLANRENAKHSTGPRTDAGKTRSSGNATTHGMTSRKVVLPHESEEEYNELRNSLITEYAPANDLELTLAIVVAETFWRRQRFYRIETAFLAQRMNAILEANSELLDGDGALCSMFTDPAEAAKARLLLRYLTAAERAHKSAVAHLEKVRKARRQAELELANAAASAGDSSKSDAELEAEAEAFLEAHIARMAARSAAKHAVGFVSHDAAKPNAITISEAVPAIKTRNAA